MKNIILQLDTGIYSVDEGCLIFAYDYNDVENNNWVQVEDLTGLTNEQYQSLAKILLAVFNYNLHGKFL